MLEYLSEINELDPSKKNHEYAERIVRNIRLNWVDYVDKVQVTENRKKLFGTDSIEYVEKQFKDQGFKDTHQFKNLCLLMSTWKVLVEENRKNPPVADIKAVDPAAMTERQKEIDLLRNRGILERDMTAIMKQVGSPVGFKWKNNNPQSNIDDFDEWGLDEKNPDDVEFFKNRHKLYREMGFQSLVDNVMMTNRFDEEILNKLTEDILCSNSICIHPFVDKVTGATKFRHFYPEVIKGIFGDAFDGSQDTVRGWEDTITISDFIQLVGNEFNFETDLKHLLASINLSSDQKYTGFVFSSNYVRDFLNSPDKVYCGLDGIIAPKPVSWGSALRFKVRVGYMQWRTWEATSTVMRNMQDGKVIDFVDYNAEVPKEQVESYWKDSKYQQQWYNSTFLVTGNLTERIYSFSKVYYQPLEGSQDEYCNGTMVCIREPGKCAVETVEMEIKLIHSTIYKMLFLIYKAKPEAQQYVWEELVELNKLIQSEKSKASGIEISPTVENMIGEIIQYMEANTLWIRTFPQVDGKRIGQIPSLENKRQGADPLVQFMMTVSEWGQNRIEKKILGNSMRLGANPQSREATKSEENSVDASHNTTGYISRIIQKTKERLATITTNYAQDIVSFKDTVPYNYLKTLLGEQAFGWLSYGGKMSNHRYGIFIRDYNNEVDRQMLRQAAYTAVTQEKILTWDEFYEIMQTSDLKAASNRYALYRYKAEKRLRQQQVQDFQMKDKAMADADQRKMQMLQFERDTILLKQKEANKAYVEGKNIDYQRAIDVKDMTIQAEPDKQAAKARGDASVKLLDNNLEQSNPYGQ